MGCTALAIDPTGIAIDVVLLFPDGHPELHLVDDVPACVEGLATVGGADAHPYRKITNGQWAHPMRTGRGMNVESSGGFFENAPAFFDGHGRIGFVLECGDALSLIVVAHPSLKRGETARSGRLEASL